MIFAPFRWKSPIALIVLGIWAVPTPAQQPLPQEQQAEVALAAGLKAFNEGNYPFAAQRFAEVIQKFPGTKTAVTARYHLGTVQINSPEQDFAKAIENLTGPANDGAFVDRGLAMYQLAVAQRGLGLRELELGTTKPAEMAQRQQAANGKFAEAQKWFVQARDWFQGQKQTEWSARCRADQAEMEIRLGRHKEARATAEPFAKGGELAKNKYRPLGLYYHGLASFLDGDLVAAGRSLNQLAPFSDPAFGLHARYLVGRVLHLSGEHAEASVNYDAVLADSEKAKKEAAVALQQPERFKNNPFERSRLLNLAQGPLPEYVAGASFHGACLSYEAGKFTDAVAKFAAFSKAFPQDGLAPDANLRTGFCQVQLKQFDDAIKTLNPLLEKVPRLADQAQFWLGKAQLGLALQADPNNPADRENKFKTALDSLRKAIEKAQQFAVQNDPAAKARRSEMQFEYGDALLAAKQDKDAAVVFQLLFGENGLPNRREEVLQRLAAAHGSAGNIQASEDRCLEFRRLFPQSVLTPAILYRQAENAYTRATEALKKNATDAKVKLEDAAAKFREVPAKYPEFERANQARYGQGGCLVQLGQLEDAVKVLEAIPAPERIGELAGAAYLLADCLIRQAPVKAEDALQENQIREKLSAAAGLLDGFASANPKAAETPAALLKLGFCLKRLGSTLANPAERNQTLQKAREAFEKLEKEHGKTPFGPQATLEKAKVKALVGDRGGALNDLRSVMNQAGAIQIAPLAAVSLATLYREQNQPAEAAKVLDEARKKFETDLAKDPARAEWVQLMRYHHGVAVFETNKPAEARVILEPIVASMSNSMLGLEATLRIGQCRIAEARTLRQRATAARNQAGNDANKKAVAEEQMTAARTLMTQAGQVLVQRAEQLKATQPTAEARGRMYYDAAWAYRELATEEVNVARETLRKEAHAKLVDAAKAKLPPNSPLPNIPVPEIELARVPVQTSEQRAIEAYKKLFEEFPELTLSVDARFELAELRAGRNEFDEAIKLLKDALDQEPTDRPVTQDTLERIRLRLGACLYSKKDYAAAATQFETVAGNPKSPYLAQATYRAGECLFSQGEFSKSAAKLLPFKEKSEFHNVGGISDRAVLRLGYAQLGAKNPDAARQAFETLLQRFGNGNPFAPDARYGIGMALATQSQHDEAIKSFEQVIAATQAEVAAKAQLHIGLCRMAQGRPQDAAAAFLAVPMTYDYPELGYAAYLEAARAYEAGQSLELAIKTLEKLIALAPAESDWNKKAKEKLAQLKK